MKIGIGIKGFRHRKGYTLKELADKSNLSVECVSSLEESEQSPWLCHLERVAYGLDVPLIILMFSSFDIDEIESLDTDLAEKLSLMVIKSYW